MTSQPLVRPVQSRLRRAGTVSAVVAAALAVAASAGTAAPPASAHLAPRAGGVLAQRAVAAGYTPTPAQVRIKAALTSRVRDIGSGVGGVVVDGQTGAYVWTHNSWTARTPASNTKVATALTTLRALGPGAVLYTRVRAGARTTTTQYVHLVGGGDPALTTAGVDRLAAQTVAALPPLGGRKVAVVVDDSLFPAPSPATGWSSGYYPHEVAPVRALIADQREVMDTALDAGRIFAGKLAARQAPVSTVMRGRTPSTARTVATQVSPPVRTLVAKMLNISDNDYAEALLRLAALKRRGSATWSSAIAVQRATLAELGVPLGSVVLYDGSGLSRSNRLTAVALVTMLRVAASPAHPELASIFDADALPVSGVSGTLASRFGRYTTWPSACAKGKIKAKTGTLRDVVALAGVTTGMDGRRQVFALVVNGHASTLTMKRKVDGLAATVTGCW